MINSEKKIIGEKYEWIEKQNIPEQKADYYYSVFLLIPDYLVEFEQQIIDEFEDLLRDLLWWRIKIEQEYKTPHFHPKI